MSEGSDDNTGTPGGPAGSARVKGAGTGFAHAPAVEASGPASQPEPAACAGEVCDASDHVLEADRFLDREVQWLEFNRRVLKLATDPRTPLIERLAFLAIFQANLDEYFQKRVGGFKRNLKAGLRDAGDGGPGFEEQIRRIREMVVPMLEEQAACFTHDLQPRLRNEGVALLDWSELTDDERLQCHRYFHSQLFAVLTPLAVDPGHPFPFLSNLSTSLGVMLRVPTGSRAFALEQPRPSDAAVDPTDPDGLQFARVKVPSVLPQWVELDAAGSGGGRRAGQRFVRLLDIIRHNLDALFDGMELVAVEPFRITRNADLERDEEDAEDLLELINQELRNRRFASAVRLEVDGSPDAQINRFLLSELGLGPDDMYEMPAELDYTDLWTVHGAVDRPDLKFEQWTPRTPRAFNDPHDDMFATIRRGDVLVHHPYESFSGSVERFINTAAADPAVIAIKLTLYRTAKDSPFIPALIRAAEAGKQVVCLVELKARFDEEQNVQLARKLEKAGIHVVYGIVGYKTHTKTALVVRQEPEGVRVYAHVGTGNYHSRTANLYTDVGLFTADPRITRDLVEMFHFLTGRSIKKDFDHLLIAPINMRSTFERLIDREIEHCADWRQRGADPDDPDRPSITAKMNQLEDRGLSERLYQASQAGVRVHLIVRGFCCLRPGIPGLSDHITVQSVLGRFLEHSRVYVFHNRGDTEYYIGSADWMYRNLNNRVECITPVYDADARARLQLLLDLVTADQRLSWDMQPDGTYTQRQPPAGDAPQAPPDLDARPERSELVRRAAYVGTHQVLMEHTRRESQV